ncbi:NAD-dependent epimerase/dehydratase family protein [Methylobacterium komagatae]
MPHPRILVTGSEGRIGRSISGWLQAANGIDLSSGDLSDLVPDFSGYDTVIHLAGSLTEDIDAAEQNQAITFNVLRACRKAGVGKLIWASSVRADEPLIGLPVSWYGASKAAQEAYLRAWVAEVPSRIAVALRFGHFCPGSKPAAEHEILRLTESGLEYWVSRALSHAACGLTIWHATGRHD